jgi:hypothetical protein
MVSACEPCQRTTSNDSSSPDALPVNQPFSAAAMTVELPAPAGNSSSVRSHEHSATEAAVGTADISPAMNVAAIRWNGFNVTPGSKKTRPENFIRWQPQEKLTNAANSGEPELAAFAGRYYFMVCQLQMWR